VSRRDLELRTERRRAVSRGANDETLLSANQRRSEVRGTKHRQSPQHLRSASSFSRSEQKHLIDVEMMREKERKREQKPNFVAVTASVIQNVM